MQVLCLRDVSGDLQVDPKPYTLVEPLEIPLKGPLKGVGGFSMSISG